MNLSVKELKDLLNKNPFLRIHGNKSIDEITGIIKEEKSEELKKKSHAIGKREDLDQFFRSSWEANVARYYNFIGVKWQYEIKEFMFPVKRGCISYKPDFYLPELDKWVEVKGYMDSKSKTKLNRFQKYYPEEFKKLILIDEEIYKEIAKHKKIIPNWE